MPRISQMERPDFTVSFRTFIRECPQCKKPIPLNGPSPLVECPECRAVHDVPPSLWAKVFADINPTFFLVEDYWAPQKPVEYKDPAQRFTLVAERLLAPGAACRQCNAPLQVDDAIWQQPALSLGCDRCGAPTDFVTTPAWLGSPAIRATHVAATELDLRGDGAPGPRQQPAGAKPVLLACPGCQGNLNVTEGSQRTIRCQFCGASVYLPEDLWRLLHPVKKVTAWVARFLATPMDFDRRARANLLWGAICVGVLALFTVPPILAPLFLGRGAAPGSMTIPLAIVGTLLLLVLLAFVAVASRWHSVARRFRR